MVNVVVVGEKEVVENESSKSHLVELWSINSKVVFVDLQLRQDVKSKQSKL